jgi:hypothetical protein
MIVAPPPRLAPSAIILVYAILGAGLAAAYQVAPVLWLVTPVVAWIVLRAAVKDARRSVTGGIDIREFPGLLRETVRSTFAQLPEGQGDARRLLLSVINQARLLFGRGDSRFDANADRQLREHVAGLVEACCSTALDLARLDGFISGNAASDASRTSPLASRAATARDLFRERLTAAGTALATLYTANVEQGTPSTDRVAELTAEIQQDAAARAAAIDEMKGLAR